MRHYLWSVWRSECCRRLRSCTVSARQPPQLRNLYPNAPGALRAHQGPSEAQMDIRTFILDCPEALLKQQRQLQEFGPAGPWGL